LIDLRQLDYRQFELLVGLLLQREGYTIVSSSLTHKRETLRGPDFETVAPDGGSVFVEVKHFSRPVLGSSQIRQFIGDIDRYRALAPATGLLVVSTPLSASALEVVDRTQNLSVWDCDAIFRLLSKYPDVEQLFADAIHAKSPLDAAAVGLLSPPGPSPQPTAARSRAEALGDAIVGIPCGSGAWRDYELACTDALSYIFSPDLAAPEIQSRSDDGLDILDAIYPIRAVDGPWSLIRAEYTTRFAVAEFKNYCDEIGQRQVESIAQYLWAPARRSFGMLVSRKAPSSSAIAQRRREWLDVQKCIVFLSDDNLLEMLQIRESGGQDFLRTLTP